VAAEREGRCASADGQGGHRAVVEVNRLGRSCRAAGAVSGSGLKTRS